MVEPKTMDLEERSAVPVISDEIPDAFRDGYSQHEKFMREALNMVRRHLSDVALLSDSEEGRDSTWLRRDPCWLCFCA